MTTTTLKTITIPGADEYGREEFSTVTIAESDGVFEVLSFDGDRNVLDSEECETLAEATKVAARWAAIIRRDYADAKRERLKEQREASKDALMATLDEMDGVDARAVFALATLIGKGKSGAAIEALKQAGLI